MESNLEQLERLLQEGSTFTFANFSTNSHARGYGSEDSPEWLVWKTRVWNTIKSILEENSAPAVVLRRAMEIETTGFAEDHFLNQKSLILSAVEQTIKIVKDDVFGERKQPKSSSTSSGFSNRIFVVHGHDHGTKTELEVFLTSLGLEPVILHRQPDQGRTLIKKFEHHSDVGFAFIL